MGTLSLEPIELPSARVAGAHREAKANVGVQTGVTGLGRGTRGGCKGSPAVFRSRGTLIGTRAGWQPLAHKIGIIPVAAFVRYVANVSISLRFRRMNAQTPATGSLRLGSRGITMIDAK